MDRLVRLRKPGGEQRKDGKLVQNQDRMGPITLTGRRAGLRFVLSIQREVNRAGRRLGRPAIDILNLEEVRASRRMIAARVWPEKWTGNEPLAADLHDIHHADGTVQPLLPGLS